MYRLTVSQHIWPISAAETSVLGGNFMAYIRPILIFLDHGKSWTSANIFEYRFINHFTAEHLLFLLHSTTHFVYVTNLKAYFIIFFKPK